jgi:hypothetical protein
MRKMLLAILPVLVLAVSMTMMAQEGPQGQASAPQASHQADPNDPVLDVTPFWNVVDTNHDGIITKEEWLAAGLPEADFAHFDQDDKDGRGIKKADFAKMPHYRTGMDTNHDGTMTIEKFKAFLAKHRAQVNAGGAGAGGGAPQGVPPQQ